MVATTRRISGEDEDYSWPPIDAEQMAPRAGHRELSLLDERRTRGALEVVVQAHEPVARGFRHGRGLVTRVERVEHASRELGLRSSL